MAKSKLGATCAAVVLAVTFASAQASSPQQSRVRPKAPQSTTITGCVVRDAANGGKATIASNGISYKLMATGPDDFTQYLGKRVEVTGLADSGSTAGRATSGKSEDVGKGTDSIAPKDQTAVGGQSDVTATGTPRDNTVPATEAAGASRDTVPLATDKGTTADLTGRLQVKSIRTVAGSCL